MDEPEVLAEAVGSFTDQVSEAVVECAGQVAATWMPLPAGLRAAAQEAASARVSAGLVALARELERGRSLEDCIANSDRLPPYVSGLIRAAQRSGDTGLTLAAWSANRRSARQYWHSVLAALAYPAFTVVVCLGLFLLFGLFVVPTFKQMYGEFGLKLPAITIYIFRTYDFGTRFFPAIVGLAVFIAIGIRLMGGAAAWSCTIANLPLIGRAWLWTGVAEMLRSLSLLVEQRVPLPEALRLTADGISDAFVAAQCRILADRVAEGRSLTMSLVHLRTLPLSIIPLVRCGEQQDSLAVSLRSAAQMLEARLKLETNILAQIVTPMVFVLVAVTIASSAIALYMPMISLIQGLS